MTKEKGQGLLKEASMTTTMTELSNNTRTKNSRAEKSVEVKRKTKPVRINSECVYLHMHREHDYFGSSCCTFFLILWFQISNIAALHGWVQTTFFILFHLIIVMPIKLLLRPPFIPEQCMHTIKLELWQPFPGYAHKQYWAFARKLWYSSKAEGVFTDGLRVWEGFCFSEEEYLEIREHVSTRISYFFEPSGPVKVANEEKKEVQKFENTGLWVARMALGCRCLPLMMFAEAKVISKSAFLIRYRWWHLHLLQGWAKVEVKREGEQVANERGIMFIMHVNVMPSSRLGKSRS